MGLGGLDVHPQLLTAKFSVTDAMQVIQMTEPSPSLKFNIWSKGELSQFYSSYNTLFLCW